jgi:hypothetical protein
MENEEYDAIVKLTNFSLSQFFDGNTNIKSFNVNDECIFNAPEMMFNK